MKKSLTIVLFATITIFTSFNSNAAEGDPWSTFKEVAHKFHTANGQFLSLSVDEQNEFLLATKRIKSILASHNDERAAVKLKEIISAEGIFKLVWASKPDVVEIDLYMQIPELPVVQ